MISQHGGSAADAMAIEGFFRGLKKESYFASQLFASKQHSGAQQDGCVGVVPTGMHNPWHLRSVINLVSFLDGQRIHIGADGNYLAIAGSQPADYASFSNAGLAAGAAFNQGAGYQGCRPVDLKTKFWLTMDGPA
jgi:hypothetical protein